MSCVTDPSERSPGRYEVSGEIGEKLDEIALNGGSDEDVGDVDTVGHYALLTSTGMACAPHAIVHVDSHGFVDYSLFDDVSKCLLEWSGLVASLAESEVSEVGGY